MANKSKSVSARLSATLLVSVVGGAGFVSGAGQSSAAGPSTKAVRAVLTPVAGSANYLVYTKMHPVGGNQMAGRLWARTSKGKTLRLGKVRSPKDDNYRLAGPTLLYGEGGHTRWRNLKTGAAGRSNAGSAAMPDGWVKVTYDDTGQYSLADESVDGSSAPLGSPFEYPTYIEVATGDGNLVAYSLNSENSNPGEGKLRVMSFDEPGVYRTRMTGVQIPDEEDFFCPSLNRKFVACLVTAGKGNLAQHNHTEVRRVSLDTTHIVKSAKGCPDYPVVMHRSVAWITSAISTCKANRLVVMNGHGKVTVTKRHYDAIDKVAALGGAVFATASQHKMVLLTSANSKPKVLVKS